MTTSIVTQSDITEVKKNRFLLANQVRSAVNQMFNDASILDEDYKDIQKAYNGGPVFDAAKLKEVGVDLNNSNYLDMAAVMDNIALSYIGEFGQNHRLFKSDSSYWRTTADESKGLSLLDADLDASQNTTAFTKDRRDSDALDFAFNKTLKRSTWWRTLQQKEVFETQLHGLSFAFWEDKIDHIPKLYPRYKVKIDARCTADVDSWGMLAVETSYSFQEIFGWYERARAARGANKKVGYQEKALAELLFWYEKGRTQLTGGFGDAKFTTTAIDSLKKYKTGSLYSSNQANNQLLLYNVFIKEADNSITRYIIDATLANNDFLFNGPNDRKSFQDIIYPFTRKPYLEYLLEQVGVGSDIYDFQQSIQELTNYAFEQGKNSSGIIVSDPEDGRSATPVDILPGVGVYAGANQITSNTIGSNLGNLITLVQHLEAKLRNNLVTSGYSMNINDLEFSNDKQIAMFATQEAKTRKNVFSLYYQNIEPFGRRLLGKLLRNKSSLDYKRLMGYLKEKQLDFGESGMPMFLEEPGDKSGVPETIDLTVSYSYGSGSQLADQLMADKIMAVSGSLETDSQRKALEIYLRAWSTAEITEELLFTASGGDNSRSRDKFFAVMAANQLEKGEALPPADGFDNLTFADTFVTRMTDIIKAWTEGTYGETQVYVTAEFQSLEGIPKSTPSEQAFEALFLLYSAASFHVAKLISDTMNMKLGQTFKTQLGELLNPLKEIEARARTDAEARSNAIENRMQQESDIRSEDALKQRELLNKMNRENMVAQHKMTERENLVRFNSAIKVMQLAETIALDRKKQEAEREKAITDVTQKNAITALNKQQQNL